MSEPKFKEGDRVKNLKNDSLVKEHATGTVVSRGSTCLVEWDSEEMVKGPSSNRLAAIHEDSLELMPPPPLYSKKAMRWS